ncbi:MAG: TlpA disulfide reductase family protein [Planctomycetota bacterium]|jgi:thiol-disulfide isomerase/thioredoxin
MLPKPKPERCIVAAVCFYLILVTTSQVCFAGALKNPLISKEAPKLDVAEWLKGKPATLQVLKGKVVLLYFWAAPNTASLEKFPELIRFHKKYARDGLVIIAIHDSSLDKKALIEQSSRAINLPGIRFTVAIDSPAEEPSDTQMQGKGKTIAAYGVTKFPAHVLIGPDRKIQSFGAEFLEKRINLLLYGHTRNLNTKPASQDEALTRARKEFMLIAIGAALLILVGTFFVIRRRLGNF